MTPSDRITGQTRLSRPMSRQAFRPGQWNGVRLGNNNNTYIQNNFYGPQTTYRGWGDAWASYTYGPSDCGNAKPSWLEWTGFGTALLGGLLNLFGAGKKKETPVVPEEKGTTQPPDNSNYLDQIKDLQDQVSDLQKQLADKDKVKEQEPPAAAKKEEPPKETTPDTFNWNVAFNTDCRDVDANGNDKTQPIKGTVKVTQKDSEENKAPKEFTITTASGNIYTFKKIEGSEGEDLKYVCTKCTTRSGAAQAFTKGNIYRCEMDGNRPVLRQHDGDAGSGKRVGEE